MADTAVEEQSGRRDRSPSYPFISLKTAIDRLSAFDGYFKRYPAPMNKIGLAWGMKGKSSQAGQTVAALKSFGLVEYQGSGSEKSVVVTDEGRTYLRAQQESVKADVLKRCAMKSKAIAKYWGDWGADRPPDPVCLDELVLKGGFTQSAAETFLSVYDASIAFAGLGSSDKIELPEERKDPPAQQVVAGDFVQWEPGGVLKFPQARRVRAVQEQDGQFWVFVDGSDTGLPLEEVTVQIKAADAERQTIKPPILPEAFASAQEREWIRGPLSSGTSYRLFVSGDLGPKEIGKLIKLLEAQKAVLSDDEEEN